MVASCSPKSRRTVPSWPQNVRHNTELLTLMCVIVSHFTTLRHLVCQWDRHFLQAEVFLKCASLASHFHEMVCHMFDSNVRRWNVMVCHFLWRKVRHGIKMYDSHRYNDAPFPGVKRCVLQMTSALVRERERERGRNISVNKRLSMLARSPIDYVWFRIVFATTVQVGFIDHW